MAGAEMPDAEMPGSLAALSNLHSALRVAFPDDAKPLQRQLDVDVRDLDADFYVFTGHKTYGPTGIGVLYGKKKWLENLPPFLGGGDMIRSVTFDKTEYNDLPYKFEAGTPPIIEAVGLGVGMNLGDLFDHLVHEALMVGERERPDAHGEEPIRESVRIRGDVHRLAGSTRLAELG